MTGEVTTVIKKQDGRPDKGGYGFIRGAEDGHDRFFHARDLVGTRFEDLQEGARVEFEPTAGNKSRAGGGNGLRAEQVRVIPA